MKTLNALYIRLIAPLGLAGLFALAGGTGLPGHALAQEASVSADQALFYPPLPNEPRLQFLTKLSTPLDVSGGREGMKKFLFGGAETEGRLVNKPYGLAIFEGAVYVPDLRGNGYGVFDLAAGKTRFVKPGGAGAMKKPTNITIDTDGTRYITDTERNQVLVFDRQDRFLRAFGTEGQFQPGDVAIAGEKLFVTDLAHMQVHVLDKRSGQVLLSFGGGGAGEGQFVHPTSLAVDEEGTLWVSDTNNFRLQQFSPEGELLSIVGKLGTGPGQFSRPKGLDVDKEGLLYVVDAGFQNVQILDTDGTPLLFFGGPGAEPSSLNLPAGLKIDYDNVQYFQKYAHPDFEIEYLVLVANQFGTNSVAVFGFGSLNQ